MEPDVGPFSIYLEAFYELGTCRVSGLAEGPIPFTAMVEYFKIYRIGNFEEFKYLIRRMDNTYLEIQSKKAEKNSKAGAKSGTKHTSKTNNNKSRL